MRTILVLALLALSGASWAHRPTVSECAMFAQEAFLVAKDRDAGESLADQHKEIDEGIPRCRVNAPHLCPYKDDADVAMAHRVVDEAYAVDGRKLDPVAFGNLVFDACQAVAVPEFKGPKVDS